MALVKNNCSHSVYCIYNVTSHFFIKNSFKIYYGVSGPRISYCSMVGWSVVSAIGPWSVRQCSVVGDQLAGGRLVGGFKKTQK